MKTEDVLKILKAVDISDLRLSVRESEYGIEVGVSSESTNSAFHTIMKPESWPKEHEQALLEACGGIIETAVSEIVRSQIRRQTGGKK
jgi:hypothetical protein